MIRRDIVAAVCLLAVPSTVRTQSRAPIRGFTAADADVKTFSATFPATSMTLFVLASR